MDDLVDKIKSINTVSVRGHTLYATKEVANKNYPIDSYREQHGPNRERFEEREGFLIIEQNISEIKQYNCLILVSRASALTHRQVWGAYGYEPCETRSIDNRKLLSITRNRGS